MKVAQRKTMINQAKETTTQKNFLVQERKEVRNRMNNGTCQVKKKLKKKEDCCRLRNNKSMYKEEDMKLQKREEDLKRPKKIDEDKRKKKEKDFKRLKKLGNKRNKK